ncbi:hypothetical protein [Lutibacter sp.]|uniref:hypothetical protein n=1 Tax=Lutibacter sp. TaxID=1925666 RepID=UPI001A354A73|nr:hypothetical protein [Lutibacter sp.]MBI9041965.1 endonuclease/exonuclease/phosphatase family protein [Lutibacter sp.]
MSISFLSWNIDRKKNFEEEISRLVLDEEIEADILLLIEAENVDDSLIESYTKLKRIFVNDGRETNLTPRFYSNLSIDEFQLVEIHDTKRITFARLNIDGQEEIIVGGVHLPSKLECNSETQFKDARRISLDLKTMKDRKDIGHNRFLLLGDFNMNPFEPGMIEPDAFNAVLSADEALNNQRTDWYKKYDYFYNPMWSFMGDRNYITGERKLPGSYYFRKTRDVTLTYWNVFDKVILRPSLINLLDYKSLRIIEKNNIETLINDDYSLKDEAYSDHLPITFKMNL